MDSGSVDSAIDSLVSEQNKDMRTKTYEELLEFYKSKDEIQPIDAINMEHIHKIALSHGDKDWSSEFRFHVSLWIDKIDAKNSRLTKGNGVRDGGITFEEAKDELNKYRENIRQSHKKAFGNSKKHRENKTIQNYAVALLSTNLELIND